jgi:hypothetical protein
MAYNDFLLAAKSTVDKLGLDLAANVGMEFIDLDNVVKTQELFSSDKDAVVWEFNTFTESPKDPLYLLTFNIGGRTVRDSASYVMLKLNESIREVFSLCARIQVKNYSEEIEGPLLGYFMPTEVVITPQQYDKVSGIRMMTVTARSNRYV